MWSQWHQLPSKTRMEITEEIIGEAALYFAHQAALFARELANAGTVVSPGEALSAFEATLQKLNARDIRVQMDRFVSGQTTTDTKAPSSLVIHADPADARHRRDNQKLQTANRLPTTSAEQLLA